MNPGVIDVLESPYTGLPPGDGWIFAGDGRGSGGGGSRYGVASWNWAIRALTVQTGAPQISKPSIRGTTWAANGLPGTETCSID